MYETCLRSGGIVVRKYWLGLWYGNKKTKSCLWGFLIILLLFIICSIGTIVTKSMELGIVVIFLGVFTFVFWLSLSFGEIELGLENLTEGENKEKETQNIESHHSDKYTEKVKNDLERYGKKQVEQLFQKYKVKKYNKPVMVDSSKKYRINQCPAYIWSEKDFLYLLVLEREPRRIAIELSKLSVITFERGVVCNPSEEYVIFKDPSMKRLVYSEFLPTYHKERRNYIGMYTKNLYVLNHDIKFTNTSASNLFQVCPLDFQIEDPKIEKMGKYWKEGYRCNLLWKDGVYSIEQYKKKVQEYLKELAESNLSDSQFQEELLRLIQYSFITNEYAQYYLEWRKNKEKKKSHNKG